MENLLLEEPVGIYDKACGSPELDFLVGIVDYSFENMAQYNPLQRKALYDANAGDGIIFPNTDFCLKDSRIVPIGNSKPTTSFNDD